MTERLVATEHYIASLDLLAGKSLIYNDTNFDHLNRIRNIYHSWIRIREHATIAQQLKIKIFSDNIIIAIENTGHQALANLLEFVGDMAEHFLQCGYKIRGGIDKGELHIDETFVWGKGLVSAYLLESNCANYPRILISASVLPDISPRTTELMVVQDKDGLYYFNYLRNYGKNASGYLVTIDKALQLVEEELSTPDLDEKIKDKLGWLLTYLHENKTYWISRLEQ